MKKKIALLMSGILLLSIICLPVYAVDDPQVGIYRWSNIVSIDGAMTFRGTSGNYSMVLEGASGVNKINAVATLYYKDTSGYWVEIPKGWSYSVTTDYLAIDEDFTGVSGREYKVVLIAAVYIDSSGESVSKTSTKTCP